jgi:hypothetical protein
LEQLATRKLIGEFQPANNLDIVPSSLEDIDINRTAEGYVFALEFPVKGNFRVLEISEREDIHDPLLLLHANLVETELGNVSLLNPTAFATGIEILSSGHGIGVKTNHVNHSEGLVFENDWLAGVSTEHLCTAGSQRLADELVFLLVVGGGDLIPLGLP